MSFSPVIIHQHRCRLGVRPRLHWGAYSAHTPHSWFQADRFAAGGEEGLGEEIGKGGKRGS